MLDDKGRGCPRIDGISIYISTSIHKFVRVCQLTVSKRPEVGSLMLPAWTVWSSLDKM